MPAVGRRDSASAFSAAAPRCVASLLACCAGKRFAFPQLRTLAGSRIPPLAHKKAPWAVMGSGRSILMAGTEGFRVRLVGGRVPLRRFASCVLRWKTLRVSSAPHPCGFSNPSACPQESALGRYGLRALNFNGWDGGIRTPNSRHQKPEFYR